MTAKEKALELVVDYYSIRSKSLDYGIDWKMIKECVIIAVNEMIKQQKEQSNNMHWSCVNYWEEVKKEIEIL